MYPNFLNLGAFLFVSKIGIRAEDNSKEIKIVYFSTATEIYYHQSLRVTFLYILAPEDLNWDDERQPRRHELDPMEQGDELRFELHEHERWCCGGVWGLHM